ncbi:type VII toxin-antitoxin system HepT family RNase toxin [Colwellia sp. 20A7]|uniref:type VII toxin-antitoxin system HepT family RNase toxin n=1 Tax=Colwellia sp. 20A7 TaxID=2689569 RepID=UPI001357B791|nr:DUF86 domain-containing protein [Colwellia sp. 20A7]
MVDQGLTLYIKEVKSHITEYDLELKELSELTKLNNRDYRAAERLLQLLTEVSIGLSKHWLKSINKESSSNAYQTFVALESLNLIRDTELIEWRKIIGLRNALVHDYLNVDKAIVKLIIKDRKYQTVLLFCQTVITKLQLNDK